MSLSHPTYLELKKAQEFLRLLHIKTTNVNLIAAIIAWIRVSGTKWDAYEYARLILYRSVYHPLTLPPNLSGEEADANAYSLQQSELYQLMLKALKRNDRLSGVDFLYALALSGWDAAHFGGTGDWAKNKLAVALAKITGITFPPPKNYRPRHVPRPTMPRGKLHLLPRYQYLAPYAQQQFYAARHRPIMALTGGLYPPSDV